MTADDHAAAADESDDQRDGFVAAYAIRARMHLLAVPEADPTAVASAFEELSALIEAARSRAGETLGDALCALAQSLRAYMLEAHLDSESEARVRGALADLGCEPSASLRDIAWQDAEESIRLNRKLLELGHSAAREDLGQVLNTLATLQFEQHAGDLTRLEQVDAFATSCLYDLRPDWRFAIRLAAKLALAHARFVGLTDAAPTRSAIGAHALNRAQHWLEQAMRLIVITPDEPDGDTLGLLLEAVIDRMSYVAAVYESALTTDVADPDWAQLSFWSALQAVIAAGSEALHNTERLSEIVDFEAADSSQDTIVARIRQRMFRATLLAHDAVYRTEGPATSSMAKLNLRAHFHSIERGLWPRDRGYGRILDNFASAVASRRDDDWIDGGQTTLDSVLDMLEFRFTAECLDNVMTSMGFVEGEASAPRGDDESEDFGPEFLYLAAVYTGQVVPPISVDHLVAVLSYGKDWPDGTASQLRDELGEVRDGHQYGQLAALAADPSAGSPEWVESVIGIIEPAIGGAAEQQGADDFRVAAGLLGQLESGARERPGVASGVLSVLDRAARARSLTLDGQISWNTSYLTFLYISRAHHYVTNVELRSAAQRARDTIAHTSPTLANHRAEDLLLALYYGAVATAQLDADERDEADETDDARGGSDGWPSLDEIAAQIDELVVATTTPTDDFVELAEQARHHIAFLRGSEHRRADDRLPRGRAADLPVRYLTENPDPNTEGYTAAVDSIKVWVARSEWYRHVSMGGLAVLLADPGTAITAEDRLAIVERAYRATTHDEPDAVVATIRLALTLNLHARDPLLGRRIEHLLETIAGHYYATAFSGAAVERDVLTFYLFRASAGLNFGATTREELEHRYLLSLLIHVAARAQGLIDQMTLAAYHLSEFASELRHRGPAMAWAMVTRNLLQHTDALTAPQHAKQRRGIELDVARTLRPMDEAQP